MSNERLITGEIDQIDLANGGDGKVYAGSQEEADTIRLSLLRDGQRLHGVMLRYEDRKIVERPTTVRRMHMRVERYSGNWCAYSPYVRPYFAISTGDQPGSYVRIVWA
ncbi:MAG: hypothetical protein KDK08_05375 [Rhizobiaceae bacterium]|nr:hypothetical protein [Rhizobiaceae bacterium]MCC0000900.1 hypothetical protein [Methylobacteriaceae bacterium]